MTAIPAPDRSRPSTVAGINWHRLLRMLLPTLSLTLILMLPKPGGKAPDWLLHLVGAKPPFVPFPIIAAILIAVVAHIGLMRTSYGAILRGCGGNPVAIQRAGWSLLKAKVAMF